MPNFNEGKNMGGAGKSGERSDHRTATDVANSAQCPVPVPVPVPVRPLPLALKQQHTKPDVSISNHLSRLTYSQHSFAAEPLRRLDAKSPSSVQVCRCAGVTLQQFQFGKSQLARKEMKKPSSPIEVGPHNS